MSTDNGFKEAYAAFQSYWSNPDPSDKSPIETALHKALDAYNEQRVIKWPKNIRWLGGTGPIVENIEPK